MARINDGGNFGDDPFAKLMAMRQGGSASLNDLNESDKNNQDAITLASGVMGTVSPVKFQGVSKMLGQAAPEAEQAAMSWADKIRQAASNSKVAQASDNIVQHNNVLTAPERVSQYGKVIAPEGNITNSQSMYQKGSQIGDAINAERFQNLKSMLGK